MEDFKHVRNDLCGCGSGKKHKKCCGRFNISELFEKLARYASENKQKDKLIQRALELLGSREDFFLCLVDPKPDREGIINWTQLSGGLPADEREAVITRHILAGYLATCLLIADKGEPRGFRAVIDANLASEEVRAEFVAFARIQADMIATTLKGKISPEDGWLTAVPWELRSYPGMPIKTRPPETIRIEASSDRTKVRVVRGHFGYMDLRVSDSDREESADLSDDEFALDEAQRRVHAMMTVPPPQRLVVGDRIEIYLDIPDSGIARLLAVIQIVAPSGLEGAFAQGGAA